MTPTSRPPSPKPDPGPAPRRRPYRPPVIVEYGSIAARTLAAPIGSVADAMGMLASMPCY